MSALAYTYDVTSEKPWTDEAVTTDTSQTVSVRSYVPGSNTITYRDINVYSSNTAAGSNSLGDSVGYVSNIYGTSPAWVDPYDGYRYSIMYPTYQVIRTLLFTVNDNRIALGDYYPTGATRHPFLYDLIHRKYTILPDISGAWVSDMNEAEQIVGIRLYEGGAVRKGFVYDCKDGLTEIEFPGATWTIVSKIDDQGNIYGTHNAPGLDERYFIARPDTPTTDLGCSLVGRDDTFKPIKFHATPVVFEMGGDTVKEIVVADVNQRGRNDILIDYGQDFTEYEVVMHQAEGKFQKSKTFVNLSIEQVLATKYPDVTVPVFTDVNNDGIEDQIIETGNTVTFSLGKGDGTFHYVPQTEAARRIADINNDGYLDLIKINGKFVEVYYQRVPKTTTEPAPTDTTVTDPVVTDPAPADPVATDPVPTDATTDPVVTDPVPTDTTTTDSAPADTATVSSEEEAPYVTTLDTEFPGMTLVKISIEDDGSADFKITYGGETIEGFMSGPSEITEIGD